MTLVLATRGVGIFLPPNEGKCSRVPGAHIGSINRSQPIFEAKPDVTKKNPYQLKTISKVLETITKKYSPNGGEEW